MKATFEDFLNENRTCAGLKHNKDAQAVFNILSKDENIFLMLDITEQNQPALAACVVEIEKWHNGCPDCQFPLDDTREGNFNKTAVGRMVKTVLKPFGYEVHARKAIPAKYRKELFSTATTYKKTGTVRLVVKKMILPAEE